MKNLLLKNLLYIKVLKSKDQSKFIDHNIKQIKAKAYEGLEKALSSIYLLSLEVGDLKELLEQKLKSFEIPLDLEDYESFYKILAENEIKELKESLNLSSISFSFEKTDIATIDIMKRSFYWAKSEYSQKIANEVKDIIEQSFKGDLPRREIGLKLQESFEGILKSSLSYFEGLSDHIILQSQNLARINQAEKYDVKYYRIEARLDHRTTPICRSMHGRLIEAKHIYNQRDSLLKAQTNATKKAAAAWQSASFLGSDLPKNLGIPPYHFRCRTQIFPCWVSQKGGQRYVTKQEDDIISHIDKINVQRRADIKSFMHSQSSYNRNKKSLKKEELIKALNSINEIAPSKKHEDRVIAKSQNAYIIVFKNNYVYTFFKPNNLKKYWDNNIIKEKKEIIKTSWWQHARI